MPLPIVAYLDGIPLRGEVDPSVPVTRLSPKFTSLVDLEWRVRERGEDRYISIMAPLSLEPGNTRFKRKAEFSFTDNRFQDAHIDIVVGADLLRRPKRVPRRLPPNVVMFPLPRRKHPAASFEGVSVTETAATAKSVEGTI